MSSPTIATGPQPMPTSYVDERGQTHVGGTARQFIDEDRAEYGTFTKLPMLNEYASNPTELAATLHIIEEIRASLMEQSERMTPHTPRTPRTPHRTRLPRAHPESFAGQYSPHPDYSKPSLYNPRGIKQPTTSERDTERFTFDKGDFKQAGLNGDRKLPIAGGRDGKESTSTNNDDKHVPWGGGEVHFPKELPPREQRQSTWRRSLHHMNPANRHTSTMLFGPGGPATRMDPVDPTGPDDWKGNGSNAVVKHDYLHKLSKALLLYGSPGHRLERYLSMTAIALETTVDFTFLPDSLTMYIDDAKSHSGYCRLIKGAGTDLGRWLDAHNVSKHVINNEMTIEEGIYELNEIAGRQPAHSDWFLLFIYGLAGIGIAPFAYGARFVDLPLCFVLSIMLGVMQIKLAPRNHLYSVLFEVSAAIIFSFVGRLLGSIKTTEGDRVFCYGAISEAAINLVQPGYWITNACLELMNRQIATSGSRIMYALVYALLLAYGVSVGSGLYGLIDHDAVASTVCEDQLSPFWNLFFVPFFSIQVAILGGAKWKQLPVMVFITFSMYCAFFFSSRLARGSFTVGTTAGGLTMALLGNAYARMGRKIDRIFEGMFSRGSRSSSSGSSQGSNAGSYAVDLEHTGSVSTTGSTSSTVGYTCAAAAMVPAMIVLVPSGLANRGSHLAGILAAESIVRNKTGVPDFPSINAEVFTATLPIYLNVIQASIGIAVGLSVGALAVYPFGKSRSWVMSW